MASAPRASAQHTHVDVSSVTVRASDRLMKFAEYSERFQLSTVRLTLYRLG